MGDRLKRGRYLLEALARLLDPEEREATLGDLAESKTPAGIALLDVAGLAARRQLALWKERKPGSPPR